MDKITKDMMIKEIFLMFPEKADELGMTLAEHGVRCAGCCASAWETLEEGLKSHGMAEDEIDKVMEKLNAILKK